MGEGRKAREEEDAAVAAIPDGCLFLDKGSIPEVGNRGEMNKGLAKAESAKLRLADTNLQLRAS